jgi:hypothetical protein
MGDTVPIVVNNTVHLSFYNYLLKVATFMFHSSCLGQLVAMVLP